MKSFIRTGALGAAAAAAVLVGATAAHAAGTYVSVNGSTTSGTDAYTATNDSSTIAFNTNYGTKMECTDASISGNINRGTEVTPSNVVGTIGTLGFSGCTMSIFDLDVTMTGGNIVVRDDPSGAGADVEVTIEDISAHISANTGGTCEFDADGTLDAVIKAGSGGKDATLELVSAQFAAPPTIPADTGFDLVISNVNGCGGEVLDDDLAGAWDSDKGNGIPSAFEIDTTGVVTHN